LWVTSLQVVMTALRAKQAELQAVLDKLAALDADLAEKTARKESLEAEVELCKVKLDRQVCLVCGCVHVRGMCIVQAAATAVVGSCWQTI
jgi:multidrug resistance efflux pump